MLWNCQRYDLAEGAIAHDYSLPPGEATLRYRTGTTVQDRVFASYHWEAIFAVAGLPRRFPFNQIYESGLPWFVRAGSRVQTRRRLWRAYAVVIYDRSSLL